MTATTVAAARAGLRSQITTWPSKSRLLWWVGRPICTLTALLAAVIHIGAGAGVVAGCAAAAIAVVVRTVGRPWAGLAAAVISGVLVPAVGVSVAVRTLVGVIAVRCSGSSWRDGMETVRRGRRSAFTQVHPLPEAWAKLAATCQRPEDDPSRSMGDVLVAAWCTADAREIGITAGRLLKLVTTGSSGPVRLPFELNAARLELMESAIDRTRRVTAGAVAVAMVAALSSEVVSIPTVLVVDGGWVRLATTYALTFLLAHHLARNANRSPTLLVLIGVGLAIAAGLATVTVLACAVVAVALGSLLRAPSMKLLIGRTANDSRLPIGVGWGRAGRAKWTAAAEARRQGRPELARRLWSELARDHAQSRDLQVAAAVALADEALRSSELQQALERTQQCSKLLDGGTRSRLQPRVWAVSGRVYLAAGDTAQARELLELAVRTRAYRRDPEVRRALDACGEGGAGKRLVDGLATDIARATAARDMPALHDRLDIDWDGIELEDDQLRAQIRAVQSRGWLAVGGLELDHGDARAAATSLRRAVTGLSEPSDVVEQAVARTLLGAAMSVVAPHRAPAMLAEGVHALEERRGSLSAGRHRSQLIVRHARVYEHVFRAVEALQNRHEAAITELAAEVAESLRRSSLARTLRDGGLKLSEPLKGLQHRVATLEAEPSDEADRKLGDLRNAFEHELSELFASSYLPEAVHYEDLRRRAVGAHVLVYHLHEVAEQRIRGHVVWIPALGSPVLAAIDIADPALLDLVGTPGRSDQRTRLMNDRQDPRRRTEWVRLGAALLPQVLRNVLTAVPDTGPVPVVVVPHGPLSALPWAAVRLDDGRPLVAAATLQLVPSLAFLDSRRPHSARRPTPCVVTHLGGETTSTAERSALDRLRCRPANDQLEFLDALHDHPDGAYLAVHGADEGLAQSVAFGGGGRLSAAAALGHAWPPWVVFASCLVGRIDFDLGEEPLGLPISCVLGGADTVIGGVIEVGYAAGSLAARVAGRIAHGEHPAAALRAEQLRQLRRGEDAPPTAWASLTCISRVPPPVGG
jgi:CHAT domain